MIIWAYAVNHHQMYLLTQLCFLKDAIWVYHLVVAALLLLVNSSLFNLCSIYLLTRMPDSIAPSMYPVDTLAVSVPAQ